jgi:hypothetical protein
MEIRNMGNIMALSGRILVAITATVDMRDPTDRSSPAVRMTKV